MVINHQFAPKFIVVRCGVQTHTADQLTQTHDSQFRQPFDTDKVVAVNGINLSQHQYLCARNKTHTAVQRISIVIF
jgi:hypothetical protein